MSNSFVRIPDDGVPHMSKVLGCSPHNPDSAANLAGSATKVHDDVPMAERWRTETHRGRRGPAAEVAEAAACAVRREVEFIQEHHVGLPVERHDHQVAGPTIEFRMKKVHGSPPHNPRHREPASHAGPHLHDAPLLGDQGQEIVRVIESPAPEVVGFAAGIGEA